MTLTVADIERWDAGDVREVFHAARSRAQAAFDAADGLATLPSLTSFGGVAADAAKDAIGKTRTDLDAHGNEAMTGYNVVPAPTLEAATAPTPHGFPSAVPISPPVVSVPMPTTPLGPAADPPVIPVVDPVVIVPGIVSK